MAGSSFSPVWCSLLPLIGAISKALECLSLGWPLAAPYRVRSDPSGFSFIADLGQAHRERPMPGVDIVCSWRRGE